MIAYGFESRILEATITICINKLQHDGMLKEKKKKIATLRFERWTKRKQIGHLRKSPIICRDQYCVQELPGRLSTCGGMSVRRAKDP